MKRLLILLSSLGSALALTAACGSEHQASALAPTSQAGSTCAFAMNGTGVQIGADTFRLDYTGTSCLGPIQGMETLRLASSSSAPAPAAPAPAPAPAPPAAPTGSDPVDLHTVTVTG